MFLNKPYEAEIFWQILWCWSLHDISEGLSIDIDKSEKKYVVASSLNQGDSSEESQYHRKHTILLKNKTKIVLELN